MQQEGLKKCPYCHEPIRTEALKCRYCGEWLDNRAEPVAASPAQTPAKAETQSPRIILQSPPPQTESPSGAKRSTQSLSPLARRLITTIGLLLAVAFLIAGVMQAPFNDANTEALTKAVTKTILQLGIVVAGVAFAIGGKKNWLLAFALLSPIAAALLAALFYSQGIEAKRNKVKADRAFASNAKSFSTKAQEYIQGGGKGQVPTFDDTSDQELTRELNETTQIIAPATAALQRQLDQLSQREVFDQSVLTNEQALTQELHKREEILRATKQTRLTTISALYNRRNANPASGPRASQIAAFESKLIARLGQQYDVMEGKTNAELKFLQFMVDHFREYHVQSGHITFNSPAISPSYNALAKAVSKARTDLESLVTEQTANTKQSLDKLGH